MDYSAMFQNFVGTLVTGILGVLAAFLIGVAKEGFDWLRAKITAVNNETAQKCLGNAMAILESTVYTTVTSLQQTAGDEIKQSLAKNDGKYTREDLLALKDKASEIIITQLDEGLTSIIEETYGDIMILINNMIETQVYNLKKDRPLVLEASSPEEEDVTKTYLVE